MAIVADYPGLLPVSHVSNVGAPTFRKESFVMLYLMLTRRIFIETTIGTPCGTRGGLSARGAQSRQAQKEGGQDRDAVAEVFIKLAPWLFGLLARRDDFNYVLAGNAGLYPGTLPATPPAAGFLNRIHGRRLMSGQRRTALLRRIRTGFPPQILKWRVR